MQYYKFNIVCFINLILLLCNSKSVSSQQIVSQKNSDIVSNSQILFSNMDSWYYNEIKESSIIGGETKRLYQIGDKQKYTNLKSAWATTNLHAKIGVDVAVPSVFPEQRDNGNCCRMECVINKVDVIGFNINVLVSGTIFLGDIAEPVRSIKNPIKKLNHGIRFSSRPVSVKFSYKYKSGQNRQRVFYDVSPVTGPDKGEFCMILQKRWEDEKGNIYAVRIGGARCFFNDTGNKWINDTTITVLYGDLSKKPFYDAKLMGLIPEVSELYVKNSKNKMVPIIEKGWDLKNELPTHLVLYFTASYEGINFIGSPQSVLWVDNIKFQY